MAYFKMGQLVLKSFKDFKLDSDKYATYAYTATQPAHRKNSNIKIMEIFRNLIYSQVKESMHV